MTDPATTQPTDLVYHRDAEQLHLETAVLSIQKWTDLTEDEQALFKQGAPSEAAAEAEAEAEAADAVEPKRVCYAVVTAATIFHPQGGGQPSDEGSLTIADDKGQPTWTLEVACARMDDHGRVLHFGFVPLGTLPPTTTTTKTLLAVDPLKRRLYSRLHTAGHVVGAAVRHEVAASVPGFAELKASHAPGKAACEFRGRIMADHKTAVQTRVDRYVEAALPVEIVWWDRQEFAEHKLEWPSELPIESRNEANPKLRVVHIVGAEAYPCGGTHVATTDQCGQTTVTKIARSKGTSRVSYTVAEA